MELKEYYESLRNHQMKFRMKIQNDCGVTATSVYRWVTGDVIPGSKLVRDKIAEITGIPVDELFPEI